MKKLLPLLIFAGMLSYTATAQNDFSGCSAIFLGDKMLVSEYTTSGFCSVQPDASGALSMHYVTLESAHDAIPGPALEYMVAIRDGNTGTMVMFSKKAYKKLPIEAVLKQCKSGDTILMILLEREWAVPHCEIKVL